LQAQIDDLSSRRKELRERTQRRGEIETRLSAIDDELERREQRIGELETEVEQQRTRIDELESEAETFENAEYGDVIDTHRELNRLELELEGLEDDRDDVQARIEEIEGKIDRARSDLEDRRETVVEAELTDLRTRVDRIEENAVDAFNEHMESILSILEYRNIDRIWIDRREKTVRGGGGRSRKPRSTCTSSGRPTTERRTRIPSTTSRRANAKSPDWSSHSQGYLVHDVYEIVPFMLLDSLEAIDSTRIADLVEYFEEHVDCLVVALLREDDAESLSDEYAYVREI